MKKLVRFLPVVALAGAIFMFGCSKTDSVNQTTQKTLKSQAVTGNGAPSGAHYNLNIIGVPKGKTADMTGNNGGVIFVSLTGNTKINLSPGTDFQVTDANGTDGTAAFTLPDDVATTYTVWARALGGPGGTANITTCAQLVLSDGTLDQVCSDTPLTMTRTKTGAPKFTNVSKDLLYVTIAAPILDASGNVLLAAGSYPLFDAALQDYFWSYDNNGLKILQLRFYPKV